MFPIHKALTSTALGKKIMLNEMFTRSLPYRGGEVIDQLYIITGLVQQAREGK
jgi:hypothetical protein